jgi:hypothetical protein
MNWEMVAAGDTWALVTQDGNHGAALWKVEENGVEFYYILDGMKVSAPHSTLIDAQEAAIAAYVAERMK